MMIGLIILATSTIFVPLHILHPMGMIAFLILTSVSFSLFGFMLGIWADSWEKLQVVPLLVVTPLTFLGGSFYSIDILPSLVAHDYPLQSRRVPDQRISLELLRALRCRAWREPRLYRRVPDDMSAGRVVDAAHWMAPQAIIDRAAHHNCRRGNECRAPVSTVRDGQL